VNKRVTEEVGERFAAVMTDLKHVSGWEAARADPIALGLENLAGIETTVRDQVRSAPLETTVEFGSWGEITVPTLAEMLRIKAWLVISRNATRDYIDAEALAHKLGFEGALRALSTLDDLYPQTNGSSVFQQLVRQLAAPRPFDLPVGHVSLYRIIEPLRSGWPDVQRRCRRLAADLMLSFERTSR
jgi:hypothetical protein